MPFVVTKYFTSVYFLFSSLDVSHFTFVVILQDEETQHKVSQVLRILDHREYLPILQQIVAVGQNLELIWFQAFWLTFFCRRLRVLHFRLLKDPRK